MNNVTYIDWDSTRTNPNRTASHPESRHSLIVIHDGGGIAHRGIHAMLTRAALCVLYELERALDPLRSCDGMQQQRNRVTSADRIVGVF